MMIDIAVESASIVAGELDVITRVRITTEMPAQDEQLPFNWELISQEAGLALMRKLFRFGIEKSDLELVLSLRAGEQGAGIVRMGKRRMTFKTIFGSVPVPRIRIKYKGSGKSETPSSRVWQLPRQVYISRGLKNAVVNIVTKESFSSTRKQIERESGEAGIVSKSTIGNILHREGRALAAAQQERAEQVFAADAGATVLLGRAGAHIAEEYFERTFLNGEELNNEQDAERVFDQVMWDPYQELMKHQAQPALRQAFHQELEQELEQQPAPKGKPAENNCVAVSEQGRARDLKRDRECERAGGDRSAEREPMAAGIDEARVDKARADACSGMCASVAAVAVKEIGAAETIIAQVDEVVVRKQPGDKRARVMHYQGSVKSGDQTYYCSGSTSAQLLLQVGAVLAQLGLHEREKPLLVLSDCASWITNWVSGISILDKETRMCWWHLRDRCRELVGEAFTNREDRERVRKILLKYLWHGQTNEAISYVKQIIAEVEDGHSHLGVKGIKELEALKNYLIKRQPYIPDYQGKRSADGLRESRDR